MTCSTFARKYSGAQSAANYPSYMSKVNAHYERIDPRNGVRNPVAVVDPFRMHFDNAHYNRIDPRNGVSHSVSGVNPFIMRIYFAHVSGVNVIHVLSQYPFRDIPFAMPSSVSASRS